MPTPLRFPVPLRVALAAALALVLAGCGNDAAPAAPPATAVTVVTLKAQSLTLTRELPGRVNARLVAEVRPQVDGIVTRRLFTEGGWVTAGQPLYQLDDAAYRANAASATASLARAEATLQSMRLTADRSAQLARIDAISKQDHENAVAALQQAEADVGVARAALAGNNVTLGYARITAPISGRIGKSSVTQGALVTANQAAPLATVQQLDPIHVDLTQSSSELLALRKGLAAGTLEGSPDLPVEIRLEDGTVYAHQGKLAFSEVTVDPTTGSFALRVVVDNPEQVLLPGMYVRAAIGDGVRQNAILVPQQGIARDPKGNATAMVVGKDGKVELRQVTVSRTVGDRWLVDSGLAAGDRVIVEGLQKIAPGAPVQATEARAATPAGPASTTPTAINPDAAQPAVPTVGSEQSGSGK